MSNTPDLKVLSDSGRGPAHVILKETSGYAELIEPLSKGLTNSSRIVLVEIQPITESNWRSLTEQLAQLLDSLSIRTATFIAFGDSSAIVQQLALQNLKIIRKLIIVNGSTRPRPSIWGKIIDRIEGFLPLGLPLRKGGNHFDSRPFLQRIRCPALIVTTHDAPHETQRQARKLSIGLPTAWSIQLNRPDSAPGDQLVNLVLEFNEVAAKCPQKRAA